MSFERFEALAQAWGGSVAAWPLHECEAALALMAREPERTACALTAAAALDEQLDASPRVSPSTALRDAVLASAPTRRCARAAWFAWVSSAGLAAATVAGVACGVLFTSLGSDRPPEALIQAASEVAAPPPIELSGRETL